MSALERANWTIVFSWVKALVGIYGNQLADQLAKAATRSRDTTIAFNRISLSTLYNEIEGAKKNDKKNGKTVRRQHNKIVLPKHERQA